MELKEAFITISAAAGSVATVGFLAKLFANSLASVAIKRFDLVNAQTLEKQKLEHQEELENIKSQLSKLQKEHEIVFGSLYVKREKVVINLYKLMSELTFLAEHRLRDSSIEISDNCNVLINYFELNRLYFPRDVALKINNVINTVFQLSCNPEQAEYKQLVANLKIQVYDQMESIFRELLKIEYYS